LGEGLASVLNSLSPISPFPFLNVSSALTFSSPSRSGKTVLSFVWLLRLDRFLGELGAGYSGLRVQGNIYRRLWLMGQIMSYLQVGKINPTIRPQASHFTIPV
jgi:hypothetical protein